MKLIIQIPCLNEEETLAETFNDLPKEIEGVSSIEYQVIDDGSTDNTSQVAKELGVHHIIRFNRNKGLATAFKTGVENALKNGADILVNTDADNQYCGEDIKKLVEPIIAGRADLVIGARPIIDHPEFSTLKKYLQRLGSWVLRKVSNTTAKDATSGFRALNREVMLRTNIFTRFSYTLETIIQAGLNNQVIESVDIRINLKTRESRLFKNMFQYIWRSGWTILHIYFVYRSTFLFNRLSFALLLSAVALAGRYVFLVMFNNVVANAFWPTVIFAGILLAISFQFFLTGIVCWLLAVNRKLNEESLYIERKNSLFNKN